jgi:sugar lactone lactonase YvrE
MTLGHSILLAPLATAVLVAGLVAPTSARPAPDVIPLPDGFRPEGIAIRGEPTAYVGSLADGEIRAVDLRTGRQRTVEPGDGTPSVGMKLDHRGRLWVAGGPDGDAKVVDTRTGAVLARWRFSTAPTFVNDVVLSRGFAWFTDSQRGVLYRVAAGRRLPPGFGVLPLGGDWAQVPDAFNANGIATSPDRRSLLVVQSATGLLFRVDPRSGRARAVDLGGYPLTNGDGLLRVGRILYAVQNRDNKVAVIRLSHSGGSGRVQQVTSSPAFDVPTTVARSGRWLYLPNARFGIADPGTASYDVTRVRR